MKKTVFLAVLLSWLLFPVHTLAETDAPAAMNAGFISGIWYSKNSFFIGDKIRIYSAMRNNSGYDIIGTINFYDGQSVIGSSDFSVVDGQLIERWTDWTVTPGTHNIYAKIVNPRKSEIGKEPVPITLVEDASAPDVKIATLDPDHLAPEIPTPTTTTTSSVQTSSSTTSASDTAATTTAQTDDKNILEKLVESVKKITDTIFNKPSSEPTESTNDQQSTPVSSGTNTDSPTSPSSATYSGENTAGSSAPQNTPAPVAPNTAATGIREQFAQKLTATKDSLDQKLAAETNPEPNVLLAKPFTALQNKFTFLKIPNNYIPSNGRLYSWLLGALIFILRTWWLLLIITFLLLRWLWKIFRFFYFRNRE